MVPFQPIHLRIANIHQIMYVTDLNTTFETSYTILETSNRNIEIKLEL